MTDKTPRTTPWTKEEIKAKMLDPANKAWLTKGLLAIYKYQTESEKAEGVTREDNGVGFSGCDSIILSSFAQQQLDRGFLTTKQLEIVSKKLPKYAGQLAKIANGEV